MSAVLLHPQSRTLGAGGLPASVSPRPHRASRTDDGGTRVHPAHAKLLGDLSKSETALVEP